LTEAPQIPKVGDALSWLDLNKIQSTQPYTAFATAFTNAGVDSRDITIARRNRELCQRAARWVPLAILRKVCKEVAELREKSWYESSNDLVQVQRPSEGQQGGWSQLGEALLSIPNQLSDLTLLGFQGGLYFLADHGYRPGKVLWWVTLTLVSFWLFFNWHLKVVAYTSKARSPPSEQPPLVNPKLRPLGFLFLFDRLLPAYQIDTAHYEIENYFKRMALSGIASGTPPPPVVRRLLFFEWPVERVTEQQEIDRIEKSLRVLRTLGLVFAVFLAAAVSALFIH
jgi:hypothetical protein